MAAARKRLASRRGETLVETLVAILIVGLSVVMLAGMISVSTRMDTQAAQAEQVTYDLLSQAEQRSEPIEDAVGEVTITQADSPRPDASVNVILYGGPELYSYGKAGLGG